MNKIGLKFLQTFPCLLIYASVFLPFFSFAQGLINNGAYIVLTDQSTVNIAGTTGHYTNQNGGLIKNSTAGGTINLDGNWINNATNTAFSNDGATVAFKGTTAQSIAGTNATGFYNIIASGGNTKTFNTVTSTVSRLVTVESSTTLNANNKLRLLSTASSNASVGPLLSGASVTNNVIVESYLTGGNDIYRNYRGISSPINDILIGGDKTYKQLQSKLIITGPGGTTNGFDKGNTTAPHAITIKTYDETAPLTASQFINLPNINQSTTSGKGFFLYYRGNRVTNYNATGTFATGSKVVGPTFATPENVTVEYVGPINQGPININLSYTDNGDSDIFIGSNLVGNPYPAVIDWHQVRSSSTSGGSNISPNIYIYRQDGSFATYNSQYQLSTKGGSRYIMPGQAFYVKANAASQILTFTELCKDPYPSSGTIMRFLSAPLTGKDFTIGDKMKPQTFSSNSIKVLRLNLQNSLTTEEALIAFIDGANANFDNYEDALYFSGSPLVLCTRSKDEQNLSINVLPEPIEATEIKLNIGTSKPGKHTLSFTDVSYFGGTQLFLEDTYLNKVEPISQNSLYEFEIDRTILQSTGANRLKLIFRPVVPLNFSAKKVYGGSELNWERISNQKNNSFIVERSTDGRDFKVVGSVLKVDDNKANYMFLDSKPEAGINYYRLKLLDNDNTFSYTNTISLNYALDQNEPYFQIYPNPVNDVLNVLFRELTEKATLTIYNLNGQRLDGFSISDSNKAAYRLNGLQAGVYVLKVVDGQNKNLGTEKFIKN